MPRGVSMHVSEAKEIYDAIEARNISSRNVPESSTRQRSAATFSRTFFAPPRISPRYSSVSVQDDAGNL